MEITEIRLVPINEDVVKATVTITLDHCFAIRDLKIVKRRTGSSFLCLI
jgi:stage V sporulation protein G